MTSDVVDARHDAIHPYAPPEARVRDVDIDADPRRARHTRWGIASFLLAVSSAILSVATIGYAGYVGLTNPDVEASGGAVLIAIGLGMIGGGLMMLAGVVLGVVGVFRRNRNRTFAWLGLGGNALLVAAIVAFFVFAQSLPQ